MQRSIAGCPLLGLVSGYLGRRFDFLVQRVVDSFQSFPALFLAQALTTVRYT